MAKNAVNVLSEDEHAVLRHVINYSKIRMTMKGWRFPEFFNSYASRELFYTLRSPVIKDEDLTGYAPFEKLLEHIFGQVPTLLKNAAKELFATKSYSERTATELINKVKDRHDPTDVLNKLIEYRKLIRVLGDYDISIEGAIGEAYAEANLKMIKAPAGAKCIDGWIKGRPIQVKTKAANKKIYKTLSAHYATISKKNVELKKDVELVVVILDEQNKPSHYGPVPIEMIPYRLKGETNQYLLHYVAAMECIPELAKSKGMRIENIKGKPKPKGDDGYVTGDFKNGTIVISIIEIEKPEYDICGLNIKKTIYLPPELSKKEDHFAVAVVVLDRVVEFIGTIPYSKLKQYKDHIPLGHVIELSKEKNA